MAGWGRGQAWLRLSKESKATLWGCPGLSGNDFQIWEPLAEAGGGGDTTQEELGEEGEEEAGEACVPVRTHRKSRPGQGAAGNAISHLG